MINFSFLSRVSFLPDSVIRLSFFSFFSAILTSFSVYIVASLLQVFSSLIGFIDSTDLPYYYSFLVNDVVLFFSTFFLAVLLQGFGLFIQSYINQIFAETFIFEMKNIFLSKVFNSNYYSPIDLGSTSNLITEVIPKSASYVTSLVRFFTLLIQVILLGSLCVYSMPFEFLTTLFILSLIFPIVFYFNKKSRIIGSQLISASHVLNTSIITSIKNFLFISILGRNDSTSNSIIDSARIYLSKFRNATFYYALSNTLPHSFSIIIVVFVFYYFSSIGSTAPLLISLFYLLYRFSSDLSNTLAITTSLNSYKPNFDYLYSLFNSLDDSFPKKQHTFSSSLPNFDLKVSRLSFSFNNSFPYLFSDIDFEILPGEIFLIKGYSGSGKSTLLMILLGILYPSRGTVKWGGVDAHLLGSSNFRSNLGYVGPEPFLIHGTIRDNLLYGKDTVYSDQELLASCELANADEFISSSSMGLDSFLSESGEGLSMGQKQRLCLARSLLGTPKILILDEFTANLDKSTELSLVNNLSRLSKSVTIIVSTHSDAFDEISDKSLIL